MSKELLNKLLSRSVLTTNPDTELYDYPETEEYVPVWWIKQVLSEQTTEAKCWCGNPVDTTNPDCVDFNLCREHESDS